MSESANAMWHYIEAGASAGPVSLEELQRLVARGTVAGDTLVWRAGMDEWKRADLVAELRGTLRNQAVDQTARGRWRPSMPGRRAALGGLVAVMALGALAFGAHRVINGSPGHAMKVARLVPESCEVLISVRSLASLSDSIEGLASEATRQLLTRSGPNRNPLVAALADQDDGSYSRASLDAAGVRPTTPFAIASCRGEDGAVYSLNLLGAAGDNAPRRLADRMLAALDDTWERDETTIDGHDVIMMTREDGLERWMVAERNGYLTVVNHYEWSWEYDEEATVERVEALMSDVLDVEEDRSLAAADGFEEAISGAGGGLVVTAIPGHAVGADEIDVMDDLTWLVSSSDIGADGVRSRNVLWFDDDRADLLAAMRGADRDASRWRRAPGTAWAVAQVTMDHEATVDLMEEILDGLGEDLDELIDDIRDETDVDLSDLIDGLEPHMGVALVDPVEDAIETWVEGGWFGDDEFATLLEDGVVFWIAVRERDAVVDLLEDLESLDGFDDLDTRGEYLMMELEESDLAVGLDDDTLWFGSDRNVHDALDREGDSVRSTSGRLVSSVGGGNAVALAVGGDAWLETLLEAVEDQRDTSLPSADEVFGAFTVTARVDGPAIVIETTLETKRDGVRALVDELVGRPSRRELTSDATMNLRRLFDASVTAYHSGTDQRFPSAVPLTPDLDAIRASCDDHSSDRAPFALDVSSSAWADARGWQALSFAPEDPHYYAYQYDSSGQGNSAQFTASAFGDLDCDGEFSTFVRFGRVEYGEVVGSAGLHIQNELE